MRQLPPFSDPNLLIGAEHFSDAGVYRLAPDLAIVQTTDFFAPIVDDPFTFGQIAAANALSDLYAMGAQPRTALNIVAFPEDLDLDILSDILRGGAERVGHAGAVILGGHSVRDAEVKYGLAVTGTIDPATLITNQAARPGDTLILTKPLGTGVITTANKSDRCPPDTLAAATASMITLNKAATDHARVLGVKAATDVSGFGLAGHALELARASDVRIHLSLEALPVLDGALDLTTPDNFSRANHTNREYAATAIRFTSPDLATTPRAELLFDPQTSGGLLIAIDPASADDLLARCRASNLNAARIGRVTEGPPAIDVTP